MTNSINKSKPEYILNLRTDLSFFLSHQIHYAWNNRYCTIQLISSCLLSCHHSIQQLKKSVLCVHFILCQLKYWRKKKEHNEKGEETKKKKKRKKRNSQSKFYLTDQCFFLLSLVGLFQHMLSPCHPCSFSVSLSCQYWISTSLSCQCLFWTSLSCQYWF